MRRLLTWDPELLGSLVCKHAPDLAPLGAETVSRVEFESIVGSHHTRVGALAVRPQRTVLDLGAGPVIALELPAHAGNLGAAIRVAAAAGCGGLVTVGGVDPWEPATVRGAAGLHWAVPVLTVTHGQLAALGRPLVAVTPDGGPLAGLPSDAVYLFGTERGGLSADARACAARSVAIPMRPGVSSLNLATSVAVLAYTVLR